MWWWRNTKPCEVTIMHEDKDGGGEYVMEGQYESGMFPCGMFGWCRSLLWQILYHSVCLWRHWVVESYLISCVGGWVDEGRKIFFTSNPTLMLGGMTGWNEWTDRWSDEWMNEQHYTFIYSSLHSIWWKDACFIASLLHPTYSIYPLICHFVHIIIVFGEFLRVYGVSL